MLYNLDIYFERSEPATAAKPPEPAKRSESKFFFTLEGPNESILLLGHVMEMIGEKWCRSFRAQLGLD